MTPGLVGAELANLVNEAALLTVRRGKDRVGMPEFEEAVERIFQPHQSTARRLPKFDSEIREIINEQYEIAIGILEKNKRG